MSELSLFADGTLAKTAEDAAPLLGCSDSLLRDAVTARRIPHRRLGAGGRGVVFTREDLEAFLEQCVVEPAEPNKTPASVTPIGITPAQKRRTTA